MRIQAPGHSRRRRTFAASLILPLAAGTLVACSGDGSADPGKQSTSSGPGKDGSAGTKSGMTKLRDCKVEVTLSGAVTDTLKGAGRAVYNNTSGPEAFYQFTSGGTSVQVYSKGENFAPSAVVSTKSGSFTTEPNATGLRVSTDGKSAHVDSDTVGLVSSAPGVHVKATYTCK
jgi:hypothetical protein